jgi:hypothetical protein
LVAQGATAGPDNHPTPNWEHVVGTPYSGPMFYHINGGNPGVNANKGADWQPDSVSAIDMLSGDDQYLAESNVSMD